MKKRYKITCVGLIVIFILIMMLVILGKNEFIDTSLYDLIRSVSSNSMDKFFVFITKLGNAITIISIVLVFLLIFRNWYGVFLTTTAVTSVLTNSIVKYILRRARPDHLKLIKQGGYSFPSGHAMVAIAVYGTLLYLVLKKIKNKALKIILSIILTFIIIGIGISRIYVGVHYPTDVIAGYLLAITELMIITTIFNSRGLLNEKDSI